MRTHLKRKHPEVFKTMVEQDMHRKAASRELANEVKAVLGAQSRRRLHQKPVKRRSLPGQKISMPEEVKSELKLLICDAWTSKKFSDVDVLCGVVTML
jgi:hypothetical protein